jgi:hypothetical protein
VSVLLLNLAAAGPPTCGNISKPVYPLTHNEMVRSIAALCGPTSMPVWRTLEAEWLASGTDRLGRVQGQFHQAEDNTTYSPLGPEQVFALELNVMKEVGQVLDLVLEGLFGASLVHLLD